MKPAIKVWQFYDAPEEYRKHFNSDDADWLALVPKEYRDEYIGWLDGGSFGCFYVDGKEIELPSEIENAINPILFTKSIDYKGEFLTHITKHYEIIGGTTSNKPTFFFCE